MKLASACLLAVYADRGIRLTQGQTALLLQKAKLRHCPVTETGQHSSKI